MRQVAPGDPHTVEQHERSGGEDQPGPGSAWPGNRAPHDCTAVPRRLRAYRRACTTSSRAAGIAPQALDRLVGVEEGAVGCAHLGEQVELVGDADDEGGVDPSVLGASQYLAVARDGVEGPGQEADAPQHLDAAGRVVLERPDTVADADAAHETGRQGGLAEVVEHPGHPDVGDRLPAQAEVLGHGGAEVGHAGAVSREVRRLGLDGGHEHVEGLLVGLGLLGVLRVRPAGDEQRREDEDDAGRAEAGRLPEHDHEEGDDAVAQVGRAGAAQQLPARARIGPTGGQADHPDDEDEVDGDLHEVGHEDRHADLPHDRARADEVVAVGRAADRTGRRTPRARRGSRSSPG